MENSICRKHYEKLNVKNAIAAAHPYTEGTDTSLKKPNQKFQTDIRPLYEQVTGDIRYLADRTRFDTTYLFNTLSSDC